MNRRLVILLAPLLLSAAPMQHLHRAPTAAAPSKRRLLIFMVDAIPKTFVFPQLTGLCPSRANSR